MVPRRGEVIPLEKKDNEIAISLVQTEFNGETWNDVLRLYVPEGRPPLGALIRVLAIPAPCSLYQKYLNMVWEQALLSILVFTLISLYICNI